MWVIVRPGATPCGWVNQSRFSTSTSLHGRKVFFLEQYWQTRVKIGGAIGMVAPNNYQVQPGWQWGATAYVVLAEVFWKGPTHPWEEYGSTLSTEWFL